VSREKIRVGNEIRSLQGAGGQFPTHAEIDNMALRREIGNLRKELHQIRDKSDNATTQPEE
jgi:50S ribosomal subunit-associated GTPase HflX